MDKMLFDGFGEAEMYDSEDDKLTADDQRGVKRVIEHGIEQPLTKKEFNFLKRIID